ncbi:MAG: two-component sensor histidine kinase [Ignavibacteria bacterium RIFOXYA2_FULL_37_17]|nr:MAG: two-component sensor histidine kinase [Ignavibacteria bacterium RIFOXYA2_FULL_37_17]
MKLTIKIFGKISLKLIGVVSATVVLIIGVYSYFNVTSQSDVLLAEVERHANQLSESVKNSTRYVMLLNQRDHIQEMINRIGKDPAIDNVRILNKEGEIIYSAHPEDIGKMLDKQAESCYACHAENKALERLPIQQRTRIFKTHSDSSRILGIINPIYNENSCYQADCHAHSENAKVLGVLDITISLSEVDEQIRQNEIREILFAIISITAIGFIIGFFVKRWVDHPVRELVNATDQVAAGNLNYVIKNLSHDELGTLGKSFNHMIKKLDETSQQLYQSTKMASLGQLAAGVAHEINNPLTGVLTYSSFLLKRTKDNPQMQEDLNVIVRETMRSREIVKGLLDFARQSTPKKSSIDVNDIINHAIAVVNNQLKLNKVNLKKEFDSSLPKITADANQIQQVFLNLFVNGIDAIGQNGGTLTVKTSQISLSPSGITQMKNAVCAKTHSLIDIEHKIGGMPSLRMKIKSNGNEGFVNIDPVYGNHRHYFGIAFDKNSSVNLSCPVCDILLIDKINKCPKCGGPTYKIQIPNQGFIEGCASFKDDWQKWDFVDRAGERKFVEINVTDTGCGIPPENMNKIFEPFFSTKGQRGTGLGLSVIWGIVDNHNGSITVESKVGSGTTFSVRLPQNDILRNI